MRNIFTDHVGLLENVEFWLFLYASKKHDFKRV